MTLPRALLLALALAAPLRAEEPAAPPAEGAPAEAVRQDAPGYTPADPAAAAPALRLLGYVDVGFARATGDGSSFARGDTLLPADYGVDAFAPAVNSRGDVASASARGLFTNGFLPRSLGIGGTASPFVSTVDLDVRYAPAGAPYLLFARVQLLPRFSAQGDQSRALVEQAFARLIPFSSQEFALTVGKADSVFGIEYLENEANLRTGITPSLAARYTTGQGLGAKAFYRLQLPAIWSAVSLNVAATANGTLVEALSPADASLTGRPVGSARLGWELNHPAFEVKAGVSGMYGPRNDQHDPAVRQRMLGADLRVLAGSLELRGELLRLQQDEGGWDKVNGNGPQTVVTGFEVTAGYAQAGLRFAVEAGPLRHLAVYGRYDRRHAYFEGSRRVKVDRVTAGLRLDLWESVLLKVEGLKNRELEGAPDVDNDVLTSSLVFSW